VSRQFRVRNPHVVDDTIEGEVIVIDLGSGTYFSLRQTSAEIWHGIKAGADEASIADSLAERYSAPRKEIAAGVSRLLDELAAEGLIEEGGEGAAPASLELPTPSAENGPLPFVAPVLEKHTDMQDLILLDPVHDVTEAGWPHVAAAGNEA
jgi:coenzyme PQQ synthesis protein D (PqqD)